MLGVFYFQFFATERHRETQRVKWVRFAKKFLVLRRAELRLILFLHSCISLFLLSFWVDRQSCPCKRHGQGTYFFPLLKVTLWVALCGICLPRIPHYTMRTKSVQEKN